MKDHDSPYGRFMLLLLPGILALMAFVLPAHAQPYSINWYKVAGGGAMNTTGGVYTVGGTIGQHDAVGPLAGGSYQVTGGFWALISVLQTQGAPTLYIRISGTTVVVYWLAVPGWVLQQNQSVTNAAGWTASSGVVTSGGTNFLNVASPTGYRFYRLANP